MPDVEQQLAEISQRARTAKGDQARAEAKLEALEDRLRVVKGKLSELGCQTVAEAQDKLEAAEAELNEGLARIVAAEKEMQ